jgi:Predicted membrane protein
MFLLLALMIGIVAGLRAMMAPAAVAFAARFGGLALAGTPLAFMGYAWTPWILGIAALAELVTDQLPTTPSRKIPVQFGTRIVTGALSGACVGAAHGMLVGGGIAGIVGAVVGTLGGAAARGAMGRAFGSDRPAALIEDAVAIVLALWVAMSA